MTIDQPYRVSKTEIVDRPAVSRAIIRVAEETLAAASDLLSDETLACHADDVTAAIQRCGVTGAREALDKIRNDLHQKLMTVIVKAGRGIASENRRNEVDAPGALGAGQQAPFHGARAIPYDRARTG